MNSLAKYAVLGAVILAISGCVLSSKLSPGTAEGLLFSDLRGAVGAIVKPVSAELTVQQVDEGVSVSAFGTIELQAVQATFRVLGTVQLPENRLITEVQPQLRIGDKRQVHVSANFQHTDAGWQMSGAADYSLQLGDLGQPLAAIKSAVDLSSAAGKQLVPLLNEYNQQIDLLNKANRRLDRLKLLYDDYVGPEKGPSSFIYGLDENQLQELFPDEKGLAERLHATGAHPFQYSSFQRFQLRNMILEPIFQRNIQIALTARDLAKQQTDAIATRLRSYGS